MNSKILKIIIGLMLLAVTIPTIASAALTDYQKQSIINLLISFGADPTAISNVQISLNGGTPATTSGAFCYTFNNSLGYINSGANEVINLHTVLSKEGISYSPDDVWTYSLGTANAVTQLQKKYGISPQTGYFGLQTRTKINKVYACPVITCTPDWDCNDWSLCLNGQQNRTCADSNNCYINTSKPKEIQSCKQTSGVKLQANGSDGPVNIFLTLGSGAYPISTGLNLSTSIYLQWQGSEVSSCVASDSLTPKVFSGYKSNTGSQTVTLSGDIKSATSSSNKITDTFKITCVSTDTGASVSDSVVVNLFYTVSGNCYPSWSCTSWTNCASGRHTRTCTDWNGCGSIVGKPIETESCTNPPTANIKANNNDGPITVSSNSLIALTWTSTNATSCIASGNWSGIKSKSGSENVSVASDSTYVYMITCNGDGGSMTDSVAVNVSS